jgi:stage II sporulation protein D
MSQWGANAMAKQGKTPEEIVKFFFKDIDIVKLWR